MKPADIICKKLNTAYFAWEAKDPKFRSQTSLAKSCGVKQGQISVWLKGGATPKADNLYSLAKGMGISVFELLPSDGSLLGDILKAISDIRDEEKLSAVLDLARLLKDSSLGSSAESSEARSKKG